MVITHHKIRGMEEGRIKDFIHMRECPDESFRRNRAIRRGRDAVIV